MIDKVLMGLDCCKTIHPACEDCPYFETDAEKIRRELCMAAGRPDDDLDLFCLASLHSDCLALLENQKPVKPLVLVDTWVCGGCKTRLERQTLIGPNVLVGEQFNYCPSCGRKVKWDD